MSLRHGFQVSLKLHTHSFKVRDFLVCFPKRIFRIARNHFGFLLGIVNN